LFEPRSQQSILADREFVPRGKWKWVFVGVEKAGRHSLELISRRRGHYSTSCRRGLA